MATAGGTLQGFAGGDCEQLLSRVKEPPLSLLLLSLQ